MKNENKDDSLYTEILESTDKKLRTWYSKLAICGIKVTVERESRYYVNNGKTESQWIYRIIDISKTSDCSVNDITFKIPNLDQGDLKIPIINDVTLSSKFFESYKNFDNVDVDITNETYMCDALEKINSDIHELARILIICMEHPSKKFKFNSSDRLECIRYILNNEKSIRKQMELLRDMTNVIYTYLYDFLPLHLCYDYIQSNDDKRREAMDKVINGGFRYSIGGTLCMCTRNCNNMIAKKVGKTRKYDSEQVKSDIAEVKDKMNSLIDRIKIIENSKDTCDIKNADLLDYKTQDVLKSDVEKLYYLLDKMDEQYD